MTTRKNLLMQHAATAGSSLAVRPEPPRAAQPIRLPADMDPDEDFRRCVVMLNRFPGVKTFSSCQGHGPGERHPDVQEAMFPYITVVGDPLAVPRPFLAAMAAIPHLESVSGSEWKKVIKFKQDVVWRQVGIWLLQRVLAGSGAPSPLQAERPRPKKVRRRR